MKKLVHFFDSGPSFLDPQTYSDGTPYGPKRFKEIVKECWFISDQTHTSYTDVLDLSVAERIYLIRFINEKIENTNKAIEENTQKRKKPK